MKSSNSQKKKIICNFTKCDFYKFLTLFNTQMVNDMATRIWTLIKFKNWTLGDTSSRFTDGTDAGKHPFNLKVKSMTQFTD